jgi:hypothetical protein
MTEPEIAALPLAMTMFLFVSIHPRTNFMGAGQVRGLFFSVIQ